MQFLWFRIVLLAVVMNPLIAVAEPTKIEPVVIRPTRLGALSMEASTTVLTKEELREKNSATIAEVLKDVLGVDVATTGGAGQPASVFIRGAKSEHTLVLIDGIEASDPTTTTRFFDFSSLTVENIERIEIYRGARSARFGADAIGGVINIITAKGGAESESGVSYEGGSFSTHRLSSNFSGSSGKFNYSVGASRLTTDGFSSADTGQAAESDRLQRSSVSTRFGWDFSQETFADLTFRFIDATTALDASGGPTGDDPNYESSSQQLLMGFTLASASLAQDLKSTLGFYLNSAKRQYDNFPDSTRATDYHETFHSDSIKLENLNRYALGENANFDFSLQYRQEAGESAQLLDAVSTTLGRQQQSIFGQGVGFDVKFDRVTFEVGVRHDAVSATSESVVSHSLSAEYLFDDSNTAVQINYGTGFKNPSLFQLYSSFGSTALQSEQATTLDVSVERKLGQIGLVSLTWFQTKFENLIDFDIANSRYANIANAKSFGVELNSNFALSDTVTGIVGFKSLQTRDESTGLELLRRPAGVYLAGLEWRLSNFTAALRFRHSGEREDIDPLSFARTRLPSYHVWAASLRYEISKVLEANFRIENLADLAYQEVAGYSTSRRAYYAGLSAGF